MGKPAKRVREQVVVYLTPRDRELLERMVEATGLSRTELLRRGLWQMASGEFLEQQPGSAFTYLVDSASDVDIPPDLSERPDHYLYGRGYERTGKQRKPATKARKRARPG